MKSYTDLFHYDWSMKNWCDTNDYTYALEYVLKKTPPPPPHIFHYVGLNVHIAVFASQVRIMSPLNL